MYLPFTVLISFNAIPTKFVEIGKNMLEHKKKRKSNNKSNNNTPFVSIQLTYCSVHGLDSVQFIVDYTKPFLLIFSHSFDIFKCIYVKR